MGILIAIAPTIGLGRLVPAAPELGRGLGYDVEAALEPRPRPTEGALRAR